ncbi:uncharacterized protein SETTUDRAFT_107072 [Exserohilum turcica Et28A]|uniref:N-acetyltransferase domain-containing protein n=1 Tax=Exserohilum turcicum (strain 28A) TaxID=671987 RepID=R0IVP8_EXST2|nr:uncharacterized protein SETTUDRAFT_107072 [Exserohilum turcica Et28A]EOA88656.1 hypothetical protein SETTUDRAFT_107072 [Exserohilum turcica Et28A]
MYLRRAQPSDEPAIASIFTRAFLDEDLFGRVMHPHRKQYPNDMQLFWHEWLRHDWQSPRSRVLVVWRRPSEASTEEQILGAALWQRQGDDAGAQKVMQESPPPPDAASFPPLQITQNRAADPSKKNIMEAAAPFTKHHWTGSRANNWYLSLCGVDPDFAGHSIGKMLVAWGLDQARQEGIAASVLTSPGTNAFYLKCGFDDIVGNACEGEGNPLAEAGVQGGDVLFMWGKEGRTE